LPPALDPALVRRSTIVLLAVTVLQGTCVLLFPAVFLTLLPERAARMPTNRIPSKTVRSGS
jgi:hypothetical protein